MNLRSNATNSLAGDMPASMPMKAGVPAYLLRASGLMLLGYAALTLLFQTAQMWVSPSVMTARWKILSPLVYAVLPDAWVNATPATWQAPWIRGAYLVLLAVLFVFYVRIAHRAYLSTQTTEQNHKILVLIVGVAGLCLLFMLLGRAMLSTDIYSYVWYGRIPALEGGNPYLDLPRNYLDLDLEGWMEWEVWGGALPCVYGPVWIFFAEGISYLAQAIGGKALEVHVLGHRLLSDVAHLIDILLVWRVAGLVGSLIARNESDSLLARRKQASFQLGATVTYAWNPLVLIEFGLSGHNDSLMITFLLISLLLLLKGRWRWAAVALAVAALIKLLALIFLPFYLLWLWRMFRDKEGSADGQNIETSIFRIAQALAIMVAVSLLAFWPFGGPGPFLNALNTNPAATLQFNSIAAVVLFGLPPVLYSLGWLAGGGSQDRQAAISAFYTAFYSWVRWSQQAVAVLLLLATFWKAWMVSRRGTLSILSYWGWAMLVYFMVGSLWFWPWYVSWLIVSMALVGPGRLWTAGQILAYSAMAIYSLFPPPAALAGWVDYTGLIVVVPTAIYLLWSRLSERQAKTWPSGDH